MQGEAGRSAHADWRGLRVCPIELGCQLINHADVGQRSLQRESRSGSSVQAKGHTMSCETRCTTNELHNTSINDTELFFKRL